MKNLWVLLAFLFLTITPLQVYADNAQEATGIQMLPPMASGTKNKCFGSSSLLAMTDNGLDGLSAINCIPVTYYQNVLNVTGGLSTNNLSTGTLTTGTLTTTGSGTIEGALQIDQGLNVAGAASVGSTLTIEGAVATASTINTANTLTNISCPGQALTTTGNGNFSCIAVSDISGGGYNIAIPVCQSGTMLQYNGQAFTCVAIPSSIPAGSLLVYVKKYQATSATQYNDLLWQGLTNGGENPGNNPIGAGIYNTCSVSSDSDPKLATIESNTICGGAFCAGAFGTSPDFSNTTGFCYVGEGNPSCENTGHMIMAQNCFYDQ